MKPINDWEKVKASNDFEILPAGGYVCDIISVTDHADKQYLHIKYDIAEGDHKNHWKNAFDRSERSDRWGGDFYRSYKESAKGMFKAFINAVEGSNEGYKWEWKEKTLEGKQIGLVLGEEEYMKNDGSVATWPKVRSVKTVKDIKEGRFRVPPTKRLDGSQTADEAPAGFIQSDDDLPF